MEPLNLPSNFQLDRASGRWVETENYQVPRSVELFKRLRLVVILVVILLLAIDSIFCETQLITPLPEAFLWGMRLAGAALALFYVWRTRSKGNLQRWRSRLDWVMQTFFLTITMVWFFNHLAWRAGNWWEFGLSAPRVEAKFYRVQSVHHGSKGSLSWVGIDPFDLGESAEIMVAGAQFSALYLLDFDAEHICVGVRQQRSASGAVRVVGAYGKFLMSDPDPAPHFRHCTPADEARN
jgi:hypothetical protein